MADDVLFFNRMVCVLLGISERKSLFFVVLFFKFSPENAMFGWRWRKVFYQQYGKSGVKTVQTHNLLFRESRF